MGDHTSKLWDWVWHEDGVFQAAGVATVGCIVIHEKIKKGDKSVRAIAMLPPGQEPRAKRIVACVNKLAGVEDVDSIEIAKKADVSRIVEGAADTGIEEAYQGLLKLLRPLIHVKQEG